MITLEQLKKEKISINTRTQEEYDSLMRFFEEEDIKWRGGQKATEKNYFGKFGERFIDLNAEGLSHFGSAVDDKIITPNDLKEYNEFLGRETLTQGALDEICRQANIYGTGYNQHKVDKNGNLISKTIKTPDIYKKEEACIKENKPLFRARDLLTNTQLHLLKRIKKEEAQYLNIGEAINWMLESEDNVVEYYDNETKEIYKASMRCGRLQQHSGGMIYGVNYNYCFENWTKIKKHIEPKQKTLKDKIENKEEFSYKGEWYSFNKDGAIINKMSAKAISIELIKELLTKKEKK